MFLQKHAPMVLWVEYISARLCVAEKRMLSRFPGCADFKESVWLPVSSSETAVGEGGW